MGIRTHVAGCTHGDLHGQDSAGDDEVKEPLGCRAHGDVQGAETGGGDFTGALLVMAYNPLVKNIPDENPANRSPAELEEDGPGVDQDDSKVTEPGDL